jgi:predicted Zn-dependent peptidase
MDLAVVPMRGRVERAAVLAVRFGSVDRLVQGANSEVVELPAGTAHFLEHLLFKKQDHDALMELGRMGASANAFTTAAMTVYYFVAADRFEDCLRLLLRSTTTPDFDDSRVERERAVIAHELRMYEDDPDYAGVRALLQGLYRRHPVRDDVGGTLESIPQVSPAHVAAAYRAGYRVGNMVLAVAGGADPARVEAVVAEELERVARAADVAIVAQGEDEPPGVAQPRVEVRTACERPRVILGWKEAQLPADGESVARRRVEGALLLDLLFGTATRFFESRYRRGVLDDTFGFEYRTARDYGYALVAGESDDPEVFEREIRARVESFRTGRARIARREYDRLRRKAWGREVMAFENPYSTAMLFADALATGYDPLAGPDRVRKVPREALAHRLEVLFEDAAQSVVWVRPRSDSAGAGVGRSGCADSSMVP